MNIHPQALAAVPIRVGGSSTEAADELSTRWQVKIREAMTRAKGQIGTRPLVAWVLIAWLGCFSSSARARTIFVKTTGFDSNNGQSWQVAKKTVAGGLAAAASGDQVWVATGTYLEKTTLKLGVALYGGFSGNETALEQRNWVTQVTTLSASGLSGSVVTVPAGATPATRIDGFTITYGTGTVVGLIPRGGGIHCAQASPTIANNTITRNEAYYHTAYGDIFGEGGGVYCADSSSPVIMNNTIISNTVGVSGGGVYCGHASSPVISNNTISSNTINGIHCADSSPSIVNNTIDSNSGIGISCFAGSSPSISGNTLSGQTGRAVYCSESSPTITNNKISINHGGIFGSNSSVKIINNTITGNTADDGLGGGIRCMGGSYNIWNNTIVANGAPQGGGIYCDLATATIVNNLVAFNSSGIGQGSGTGLALHNNCLYNPGGDEYSGVGPGPGDIQADPMLVAVDFHLVHLKADSPCIDMGDDSIIQPGSVDMDGEARVQAVHVDVGADEFNGTAPTFSPKIVRVSASGDDANDGSSWALAKKTVNSATYAVFWGGEIWVAAGTHEHVWFNLRNWTYLYGGFAGTESVRDQRNPTVNVTILQGVLRALGTGFRTSGLDGFTLINPGAIVDGIICEDASPIISNNVFMGTLIDCRSRSLPIIFNNLIRGSIRGIICRSSSPIISNNTIVWNTDGAVVCLDETSPPFSPYSSPVLSNNLLAFNGIGINASAKSKPISRNNCVYNPGGSNYHGLNAGPGDISADPQLRAPGFGDYHLSAGSPCADAGYATALLPSWVDLDGKPRLKASHIDIGAYELDKPAPPFVPMVICVSPSGNDANNGSSWASAKRTVQAGIDAAAASGGGEVWVAGGTYTELIRLKASTLVYGGFAGAETTRDQRDWKAHLTILDGGAAGSVVTALPDSIPCSVDGFTIRNGTGTPFGTYRQGGGVYCSDTAIDLANNTITGNSALSSQLVGSAIYSSGALLAITHNTIKGNITGDSSAGGATIYAVGDCITISDSLIGENTGFASAAVRFWGGATITDNTITGSAYGIVGSTSSPIHYPIILSRNTISGNIHGIWIGDDSSDRDFPDAQVIVSNNVITGNTGHGISSYSESTQMILNNIVSGNGTVGIYCSESSPIIANNTITGNGSNAIQVDGFVSYALPRLSNNVIAFNALGILATKPSSKPQCNHNCVYNPGTYNYSGCTAGVGDISLDPVFTRNPNMGLDGKWGTADDDRGDVRLQALSPCIDVGSNAGVPVGTLTDLAGYPRFVDIPAVADCTWAPGTCGTAPIVDLGAYEFIPAISADFDGDHDVDAADLQVFQKCLTGPGIPYDPAALPAPPPGCSLTPDMTGRIAADFDANGIVDQHDFGVFQRCYSGKNVQIDLSCSN